MTPGFRRFFLTGFTALLFFPAAPAFAQQGPGIGPNYETRLEGLEEQMRTLNGRLEQVEFGIRQLNQSFQREQSDVDARLAKLESAPPPSPPAAPVTVTAPPAAAPAVTAPSVVTNITAASTPNSAPAAAAPDDEPASPAVAVNGTLGAIKMQDGKVTGAVNNPQAPPLPPTPPDYGLTPQEQYDRAFDLLRKTDYDGAGKAFETFIEKNPQDKLIDNAKYWYGETLYVRGKYDASAVAFADAWQQNPQGNKAPDSLLKLAMSLERLEKIPDACTTLDSLKNKYPHAALNVRQSADQERIKMKCGATAAPAVKH